jgi:antirepressor protein/ORF6C domain-containing protein
MADLPDVPQRRVKIENIQVAGEELVAAILEGEGVAVPIRLVCQALGVSPQKQSEMLREHDALAPGLRIIRVPIGGRIQSVLAILHTHIAYWLGTILPKEVHEDARPKLVQYQTELIAVLNALYGPQVDTSLVPGPLATDLHGQYGDVVRQLRALQETLLALTAGQRAIRGTVDVIATRLTTVEDVVEDLRQIQKISAAQAEYIQRAIKRIATRSQQRTKTDANMYERLFAQFKIDMGIPRYDALPAKAYTQALAWLRRTADAYLPNDPDALPPVQEQLL